MIEQHFKGDRPNLDYDQSLFGGGACLNLVTLRASNISKIEASLVAAGLKLLSTQDVPSHGFTLYFYGFTSELPPNSNSRAVENRTWVYQRPFTVLEIQVKNDLKTTRHNQANYAGYLGLKIEGVRPDSTLKMLGINNF